KVVPRARLPLTHCVNQGDQPVKRRGKSSFAARLAMTSKENLRERLLGVLRGFREDVHKSNWGIEQHPLGPLRIEFGERQGQTGPVGDSIKSHLVDLVMLKDTR